MLSASVCLASADASGQPNERMVPLLLRHRQTAGGAKTDHTAHGGERTMAMMVVDYTSRFCGRHDLSEEWDFTRVSDQLGFNTAARCLELFPD